MQVENLQGWLAAVTREKDPDTGHWDHFIDMFQTVLWDELLPDECNWKMMLLLTKGNKEFRGIGLMEVLCNAVSGVINQWITS